jgi:hypothetical protein
MRAYIEYPEGRFEVTSELVVKTQALYFDNAMEDTEPVELDVRLNRKGKREDLDHLMEEDVYDAGDAEVDGITMEVKQTRYRGDDEYWKDEC